MERDSGDNGDNGGGCGVCGEGTRGQWDDNGEPLSSFVVGMGLVSGCSGRPLSLPGCRRLKLRLVRAWDQAVVFSSLPSRSRPFCYFPNLGTYSTPRPRRPPSVPPPACHPPRPPSLLCTPRRMPYTALHAPPSDEGFLNKSLLDQLDAQADAEPVSSSASDDSSHGSPHIPYHAPNHVQDTHDYPQPKMASFYPRASFTAFPNATRAAATRPPYREPPSASAPQFYPAQPEPFPPQLTSPVLQAYDPRASFDFSKAAYPPVDYPQPQPQKLNGYAAPYVNGSGMHSQTPYGPHVPAMGPINPAGLPPPAMLGPMGSMQEDISTIFVVGFPEDMQEREFQNMFTFSPGFEAATLKIPNKEYTAYGGGHYGAAAGALPPRKQIIGFAKFRTREEALGARDVLQGRRVDIDKGAVLKAEMAKKNLHTKRGMNGAMGGGMDRMGMLGEVYGEALSPREREAGTLLASPASSGAGRAVDQNPPINTLYVGNLPALPTAGSSSGMPAGLTMEYLEGALRELFGGCAGFRQMSFRPKGNGPMCFVEFEDVGYATKTLNELYGNTLGGLIKGGGIRLSYSKNPLGVRTPTSASGGGASLQQQQGQGMVEAAFHPRLTEAAFHPRLTSPPPQAADAPVA
ncbi:hypothetical protein C8R44DRAFT_665810, partial [Mycena epipterygia]